MFKLRDVVQTTRDIRAGLGEDGPEVCKEGQRGIVINLEKNEPDGVCVMLANKVQWWFKPNQLEKVIE